MESLEKWTPYVLSVVRIVAALLFMEHGLQKFFGFPSAGPPMTTILWVQASIEVVGGIALLLGAYTRPVAFILCGDMAVAYIGGNKYCCGSGRADSSRADLLV